MGKGGFLTGRHPAGTALAENCFRKATKPVRGHLLNHGRGATRVLPEGRWRGFTPSTRRTSHKLSLLLIF
ncbi:hypothetical protein WJX74_003794 [Apatococcus lobatus]|uniref:Uncharacterized protein n=1 Tax=Apatococcus lobatus TaxID=904363 RepID=A0AAW1QLM9_9CHLO